MRLFPLAALPILFLAASCAVQHESPSGITIEVDANQQAAAKLTALEHCKKYGKKPVLVYTSYAAPSPRLFYLES